MNSKTRQRVPATDLSVVMVTHQGRDEAVAALRSAAAAQGEVAVEWLVVDCGSSDGTPDAIESAFPDIEVRRQPNLGFAGGVNVALEECHGRYVLLLNPDIEFCRGTLADLVEALDARPDVGAASVMQLRPDGGFQPSIRRFPGFRRQLADSLLPEPMRFGRLGERELRPARYAEECSVDWLVGAFLVLRHEAVRTVGPLDTRFFLYSEETDLCYRLRRAGWDVRHLPQFAVTHECGGYARPELAAQLTRSKLLFAEKHFPRHRRVALRAALLLGHALRALVLAGPGRTGRRHGERAALAVAATHKGRAARAT